MKRVWRDYVADILPRRSMETDDRHADKLIHGYSGVDLEIVWAVVKTELPPVKPLIEQALRDLDAR